VVSLKGDKKVSCVMEISTYEIGKWTLPSIGCGPLAVFRREINAFFFVDKLLTMKEHKSKVLGIYECEYDLSDHYKLWFRLKLKTSNFPIGTAFAERVKLIRQTDVGVNVN